MIKKPIAFTLGVSFLLVLATSSLSAKDVMCATNKNFIIEEPYLQLVGEQALVPIDTLFMASEVEVVGINTMVATMSKKETKSKKDTKKEEEDQPETIYDLYSEQEIEILQRIVEAEATNQTIESKINVANVILNRVNSEKFPNTIKEVVFQKNPTQFSPTSDGRYNEVDISDDTIEACEKAFTEKDTTDGALFFCNPRDVKNLQTQSWFRKLTYIMKDDSGHSFYK